MACTTCGHTMANLYVTNSPPRNGEWKGEWWCSRCGTVKTIWNDGREEAEVPMAITRLQTMIRSGAGVNSISTAATLRECVGITP